MSSFRLDESVTVRAPTPETLHLECEVMMWIPGWGRKENADTDDVVKSNGGRWRLRRLISEISAHSVGKNEQLYQGTFCVCKLDAGMTKRVECEIDSLLNVSRFMVEAKYPIAFVRRPEDERGDGGTDNDFGSRVASLSNLAPDDEYDLASRSPRTDESPRSGKSSNSKFAGSMLGRPNPQLVEYICGNIGMRLELSTGRVVSFAFRTVDECDMWVGKLRDAIYSVLRWQTFSEVYEPKLQFSIHHGDFTMPPLFIGDFQKGLARLLEESRNPKVAIPNGGRITLLRGEKRVEWFVQVDKENVADATQPSIVHFIRAGKSLLQQPANAMRRRLPLAVVDTERIDARQCEVHVERPFQREFYLVHIDPTTGARRRLEISTDSMEMRQKWEEWFQRLGARKILTAEERAIEESNNTAEAFDSNKPCVLDDVLSGSVDSDSQLVAASIGGSGVRRPSMYAAAASARILKQRSTSRTSGDSSVRSEDPLRGVFADSDARSDDSGRTLTSPVREGSFADVGSEPQAAISDPTIKTPTTAAATAVAVPPSALPPKSLVARPQSEETAAPLPLKRSVTSPGIVAAVKGVPAMERRTSMKHLRTGSMIATNGLLTVARGPATSPAVTPRLSPVQDNTAVISLPSALKGRAGSRPERKRSASFESKGQNSSGSSENTQADDVASVGSLACLADVATPPAFRPGVGPSLTPDAAKLTPTTPQQIALPVTAPLEDAAAAAPGEKKDALQETAVFPAAPQQEPLPVSTAAVVAPITPKPEAQTATVSPPLCVAVAVAVPLPRTALATEVVAAPPPQQQRPPPAPPLAPPLLQLPTTVAANSVKPATEPEPVTAAASSEPAAATATPWLGDNFLRNAETFSFGFKNVFGERKNAGALDVSMFKLSLSQSAVQDALSSPRPGSERPQPLDPSTLLSTPNSAMRSSLPPLSTESPRGKVCVICGQDKATVAVCTTGKRHAAAHFDSAVVARRRLMQQSPQPSS